MPLMIRNFMPGGAISIVGATLALQALVRGVKLQEEEEDEDKRDIPFACPSQCLCDLRPSHVVGSMTFATNCSDRPFDVFPPPNISAETTLVDLSGSRLPVGALTVLSLGGVAAVRELVVARCRLRSIGHLMTSETATAAKATSLLSLDAQSNELSHLPNGSFSGLPSLRHLTLSRNRIESIHADAFEGLGRLEVLDLSDNRIPEIDWRWFCHLTHLTTVNLSGNAVQVLIDGSFRCARELTSLDLTSNRIGRIGDSAFDGLDRLSSASLADNALGHVPAGAIRRLPRLLHCDLSGNAGVDEVRTADFADSDLLRTLRLNRMRNLRLVHRRAFANLRSLEVLEMTGNGKLRYIDREAFHVLPSLRTLRIEDNGLETVEEDLLKDLVGIEVLDLHSNPLRCDCLLRWLLDQPTAIDAISSSSSSISSNASNSSSSGSTGLGRSRRRFRVLNEDLLSCRSPGSVRCLSLAESGLSGSPEVCGPRIVSLFVREATVSLSESVRIHCRSVGIPRPSVTWYLPEAVRRSPDVQIDTDGTLTVGPVTPKHQGSYTCTGTSASPTGSDSRTIVLRVRTFSTAVLVLRVGSTSVTVTWRGVDHSTGDYRILYRPQHPAAAPSSSSSSSSSSFLNATPPPPLPWLQFPVKPYMRLYVIGDLAPDSPYEICLSFRRRHRIRQPAPPDSDAFVRINCTAVSTRAARGSAPDWGSGLRSLGPTVALAAAAGLVGLVCLIALGAYGTRRYDRRTGRVRENALSRGDDQMTSLFLGGDSGVTSQTFENRAATTTSAVFDDADLEEIRSTATMKTRPESNSYASHQTY